MRLLAVLWALCGCQISQAGYLYLAEAHANAQALTVSCQATSGPGLLPLHLTFNNGTAEGVCSWCACFPSILVETTSREIVCRPPIALGQAGDRHSVDMHSSPRFCCQHSCLCLEHRELHTGDRQSSL